jgi:hypothetical protein
MSDEGVGDEASRDQIAALEAFEAKFKPEDFVDVGHALRLTEEPETLSWLRELLLPEFRYFVESCSGRKVSREEKIDRLGKLRNAAATLDVLLGPGGTQSGLPRRLWGSNLITDQFTDTLRVLSLEADQQVRRLRASTRRGGRPRKDAVRQLGEDLIRVYEKIKGGEAKDLDLKGFHRFAAAAFRCLRVSMPGYDGGFPPSPRALRDVLGKIWNHKKNEKPIRLRTNNPA